LTLPPSFDFSTTILQSKSSIPGAYGTGGLVFLSQFSVIWNALKKLWKSLLARAKKAQLHLSYIYQISHPTVKEKVLMK